MSSQIICICGNIPLNNIKWRNQQDKILCKQCNYFQHVECVYPSNLSIPYICPLCQFSTFDPFFKRKYNFIIPKIITLKNTKEITLSFYLNEEIFNMYYPSENDLLILRCLKLTTEGFSFEWPDNTLLYINDNVNAIYDDERNHNYFKKELFQEIPFKILNDSQIKFPFNKNIEYAFDYFKLNSENEIHLVLNNTHKNFNKYFITLDYIKIIDDINDVIKNIEVIKDKNKLKSILKIKDESIKEKILFLDQFSNIDIIKYPARGWKCVHLSCFDLKKYLEIQQLNRRFCCPICKKKVGQLYIDGIIMEFIQENHQKFDGLIINENYEILEYIIKNNNIIFNNNNSNFINLNDSESENESSKTNSEFKEKNNNSNNKVFKSLIKI